MVAACKDFVPPQSSVPAAASDAGVAPAPARDSGVPAASPAEDGGSRDAAVPARGLAQASLNYVFAPNPRDHDVVVIDTRSLAVLHVRCGEAPALVVAAADHDVALVVDGESASACVLEPNGDAVRNTSVELTAHVNRVEIAPGAHFALAYHDARAAEAAAQTSHATQEVSAIALDAHALQAAIIVVGLRPRSAVFTQDGTRAFVTSDGGVSVLDLADAAAGRSPSVPATGLGSALWPASAEIRVAPEASFALAFEPDAATLHTLDLRSAEALDIDLSAWLAADAEIDAGAVQDTRIADAVLVRDAREAWVALGGEQTLLRVPLPESASDPGAIEAFDLSGQPSDRLWLGGPKDQSLLVYAAAPEDGRATLIALPELEGRRVALARAPDRVLAVDGGKAIALVHDAAGSMRYGYTALRLSDGATRFRETATVPIVSLAPNADTLAAIASDDSTPEPNLDLVDLATLEPWTHELDGPPRALGFYADGGSAFVELEHPDGRIVFVDVHSHARRTLSGFLIVERVQE